MKVKRGTMGVGDGGHTGGEERTPLDSSSVRPFFLGFIIIPSLV